VTAPIPALPRFKSRPIGPFFGKYPIKGTCFPALESHNENVQFPVNNKQSRAAVSHPGGLIAFCYFLASASARSVELN
jgi:hypothetical protein